VHEERKRRHVEREPLGLARPIQERAPEQLELFDGIAQARDLDVAGPPRLSEPVWGIELRSLLDLRQEPLSELASRILPVPVERRRKRRVVPIGLGRLSLPKLSLRANLGPQQGLLLVTVRLSSL
jgi:hypothetical protein